MLEPEVLGNAAAMFMADLCLEYAAATDGWIKGIRLFCKSKRCQKSILSSLRFLFPPLPGCYVLCFGALDRISIERTLSSRIWTSTSHVFFCFAWRLYKALHTLHNVPAILLRAGISQRFPCLKRSKKTAAAAAKMICMYIFYIYYAATWCTNV